MLVVVFTLLGFCLNETGAIDKVAAWFITRKFVKGRPYAFLGMFFFSNLFIGLFMQNLALAIIYLDLTVRVCSKLGIKKGHSLYTCLIMGVMWGSGVLTTASPIAKTLPNIMMGMLDTQFGITVTYGQWFVIGIPFTIVMFWVIMLCARVMKPDVTPLRDLDIDEFARSTPPLDIRGKIALLVTVVLLMVILLPDIFLVFGILVPISEYFVRIGPTVPAIIAVIVLCLVRGNGEVVMDFPKAAKSVPMTLIVFIAAVVLMGVPISDEGTGIVAWLGNMFAPLVAGLSPIWIIIVIVAGVTVVTNLISNAVTMVLFFNIGVAMLIGTGAPAGIAAFGVIVCLITSSVACITPSASLQLPLFFGPGHVTMANSYKANILFVLLGLAVILAFIPFVSAVIPA